MKILLVHQNFPGQFKHLVPALQAQGHQVDVFTAKLLIYCEFFYATEGSDVGFDPEFPVPSTGNDCRIRLKNLNSLMHFDVADAGISPTEWQKSTFPEPFRSKIRVIHDGIDTERVSPDPGAWLQLGALRLSREDEIITFVNRNLEPYRGYHIFMRALPEILAHRPNARVLIVGGDGVSYGTKAPAGTTWKQIYLDEVKDRLDLGRVHFLGNLEYKHFLALLQISRVHVYLTYPFVLSWSLLEAMASGCAIVASDTAPLREAITNGETGLLVNFFDAGAVAERVMTLLDDKALRERLGSRARAHAVQHFDLKKVCLPSMLQLINELGRH